MAGNASKQGPSMSPLIDIDSQDNIDEQIQLLMEHSRSPPSAHEPDEEYYPTSALRNQAAGESQRRVSSRRQAIQDDQDDEAEEDECSSQAPEQSVETRKRKWPNPQVQIPVKKLKTPGIGSRKDDSVIVVAGASKRAEDVVIETTETEYAEQNRPKAKEDHLRATSPEKRQGASVGVMDGDMMSREEHERRFEEKRAQYNEILKSRMQDNKDLKARLDNAEAGRDKAQLGALKLKAKLDRVPDQEEKWFEQVLPKIQKWKRKEIEAEVEIKKAWYEKELQKAENKWQKKFETQENRHAKEQQDSKASVKHWKKEITENRNNYSKLETDLRKKSKKEVSELKPELNKTVRAKEKEIEELEREIEKLKSELKSVKSDWRMVSDQSIRYRSERNALREAAKEGATKLDEALDKESSANAKYHRQGEYVKHIENEHKKELLRAKAKWNLQYKNCEQSQHRSVQQQRTTYFLNQQNERNNKIIAGLKQEQANLETRVKGLEDQNVQLQNRNTVYRELTAQFIAPTQAQANVASLPNTGIDPAADTSTGIGDHSQEPENASPTDPGPQTDRDTSTQEPSISATAAKDSVMQEDEMQVPLAAEAKQGDVSATGEGGKTDIVAAGGVGGDVMDLDHSLEVDATGAVVGASVAAGSTESVKPKDEPDQGPGGDGEASEMQQQAAPASVFGTSWDCGPFSGKQ